MFPVRNATNAKPAGLIRTCITHTQHWNKNDVLDPRRLRDRSAYARSLAAMVDRRARNQAREAEPREAMTEQHLNRIGRRTLICIAMCILIAIVMQFVPRC